MKRMKRKIIGVTVGSPLPKPNLMQTDPTKGDYVKGKEEFLEQVSGNNFETDSTLNLKNGIMSVNTTNDVSPDDTLPVTSAGVHAALANTQSVDNMITYIDEKSDDTHYPSAKAVKTMIDSMNITDDVKTAVDSYLVENPPKVKITINGVEADENGNFNIESLPGAGGNSFVDF